MNEKAEPKFGYKNDAAKQKNRKVLIGLGLLAGVVLIILSFFTAGNNNENKSGGTNNPPAKTNASAYAAEQERKLCEMLKRIDGVSDPFVMIVLDSSSEYVYASKQSIKESSSKNGETTQREVQKELVFYEDEKKAKSPVLVKEIQPKIKGAAVVCKGIGSADMQLKIINLVSTALSLPTNKVYVISAD